MSSSAATMTRPPGPTTTPLRPSQWAAIPCAPFNHLRPSQMTNFRPGSAIPRATTLIKPLPVKVSATASRPTIQTRLPVVEPHPATPSESSRFASRHLPNPKPQTTTTVIPGAPVLSTVVDNKLSQTLETAFKVFNDRFQKDLRDFQTICTRFIVRETQEKDRWHNLYLQATRERDLARQELQESQATQPTPTVPTPPPSRRTHKRSRDSYDEVEEAVTTNVSALSVQDNTTRPIRNLRASPTPPLPSRSPIEVPTSATTSIGPMPSISHSPFTSPSPTLAPLSATSSNDASEPRQNQDQDEAVTNHMIMRFYDFGSSKTQGLSLSAEKERDGPEPSPKRRKSLDLGETTPSSRAASKLPVRSRTASPRRVLSCTMTTVPAMNETETGVGVGVDVKREPEEMEGVLGVEFEHVDIMYVRRGMRLVCRACSLIKPKPGSPTAPEPTSFSVMTSWDDLKHHCVKHHPAECADVARLHPAEIFELRRRIYASS
ncbi:hypothetical protein BJ165DRAFT_575097 [Panaeolus papilionaceus]|nr:hypothetical protein BJ165DRAFT_575097 [Panaeolus papilionaceus]